VFLSSKGQIKMPNETFSAVTQQPSSRRRWWLIAGTAALVIAAAVFWLQTGASVGPETGEGGAEAKEAETAASKILEIEPDIQRAVGLADAPVEQRSVSETIQATGVVGPDETHLARIRSLADGRVTAVAVRVGDRVATGQTLLTYDSITAGDLISEYRIAVAGREQATAEVDVTKSSLERADRLLEMGGVAKGERERRSAEHQRALAELNSARATVTSLERKLRRLGISQEELESFRNGADPNAASRSVVTAPFSGVVTEVHAAQGELINPERELFTVADLSRVWLQADVHQKDIGKIRVGQNAQVMIDSYPGEMFIGRVTNVSDVLDPDTRTAKVRCEVANPGGRLKVQMFATLALPISAAKEALVIPARAVQNIDGVSTVFVRLDEEHFEPRAVRVGAPLGDSIEVVEGLKVGERVVTEGALMLKSRLKLRVEKEEGEK
jgi:cobalt-zinc-cadmium efflux system membrane fusion protein